MLWLLGKGLEAERPLPLVAVFFILKKILHYIRNQPKKIYIYIMELLSIPDYAKKVKVSRQWIRTKVAANRIDDLVGVVKIDCTNVSKKRRTYILTVNPDLL